MDLKNIETEELLRELTVRRGIVISSWTIEDMETEIEHQAHRQGAELHDKAPITEMAANALEELAHRLESAMIETSYEIIVDKCNDIIDNLQETGWIINYPPK